MSKPKKVKVIVTLNSDVPGDFTIEPSPANSLPKGAKGDLIFRNDKHRGFNIHFSLVDNSGLGYKFPPCEKIRSAVWSEIGATTCPQPGKIEVFEPLSVEDDQMTLVVHNPNQGEVVGKFYYMLRVTNDGGHSYHPLDPGGDNKNGPIQRDSAFRLAPAATGAIVGLGAIILVNNALLPANPLLFGLGGVVIGLVVGAAFG